MKKIRDFKFLPKNAKYAEMISPVGELIIITSPKGLHAILWEHERSDEKIVDLIKTLEHSNIEPTIVETKSQLSEYFQQKRKTFNLPLIIDGTDFQKQAWNELRKIPYANTISYGEQAERIGDKKKARAVGAANGLNPIPIIIPCHRVIGSNGHLTGFGGGMDNKAFLLQLEK